GDAERLDDLGVLRGGGRMAGDRIGGERCDVVIREAVLHAPRERDLGLVHRIDHASDLRFGECADTSVAVHPPGVDEDFAPVASIASRVIVVVVASDGQAQDRDDGEEPSSYRPAEPHANVHRSSLPGGIDSYAPSRGANDDARRRPEGVTESAMRRWSELPEPLDDAKKRDRAA